MVKGGVMGVVLVIAVAAPASAAILDMTPMRSHVTTSSMLGGAEIHKLIVAGDPTGAPPDSPSTRVDPNTVASPFAGVGAIRANTGTGGYYVGSGTLLSPWHVLTAAHVVDSNNDGVCDFAPSSVSFYINAGGSPTVLTASSIDVHPNYTGFNRPDVNDDLALITLSLAAPEIVPNYDLYRQAVSAGQEVVQVGYGRSGTGTDGFTTGSSLTVKRVGYNTIDVLYEDDEGADVGNEVWVGDFDGPSGSRTNIYGGPTLGNGLESIVGPGDSGGPSFIEVDGQYYLAGINTFGFSMGGMPSYPLYGSGMGGILVEPYLGWLDTAMVPEPGTILLLAAGLPWLVLRRRR